jgi:uncharacterized protein YigA (DUF484 family)
MIILDESESLLAHLDETAMENKEIQNTICRPVESIGLEAKPSDVLMKLVLEKNELVLRLSALRLIEVCSFNEKRE